MLALLLLALGCGPRPATTDTAPPSAEPTAAEPTAATPAFTSTSPDPDTWVSDDPDGPHTVEHWLVPEGGTMLGVNRTAHDGRTVMFEYLRIEAQAQGIAYLASPRGEHPPTRFAAADSGPSFIAFENPEHDFPQRIEYRRDGDRLEMRISGTVEGAARAHTWSMRRAGG